MPDLCEWSGERGRTIFLDYSYADPRANLALEEVLLESYRKDAGGPLIVRFWENLQPVVVIGRGERAVERVKPRVLEEGNIPVLRRISGGGTVVQGPGNLNLSFFVPMDRHPGLLGIRSSYELILGWVIKALKACSGAELAQRGTSDLCIGSKKISGTAQARKRYGLLHHMTLMVDFDLSLIAELLTHPDKEPDYRGGRSHEDFLTSFAKEGLSLERSALIRELGLLLGRSGELEIDEETQRRVLERVEGKYSRDEWNLLGRL
ncbi:MAG: lipoate--protein ligase family protein [Planctomycetes bacterium]|nr:lipoate--protein ligase family protein [Planctomycetota bacterium]